MRPDRIRTLLAVMLAAPIAGCAETTPGETPSIDDVLARAQDALGAPDASTMRRKPRGISTQRVTATGQRFDPGQTYHLGDSPLLIQDFDYTRTRDLDGDRVRTAWNRAAGYPTLVPFAYDEVVHPGGGYFTAPHNFQELLTGMLTPAMTSASVDATLRNRELDEPHVLIAEAIAHPDHVTGFAVRTIDGRLAFEIALARPFAPTRVAIDAASFLPVQTARLEDEAIAGDAEITVRFSHWIRVSGVRVPTELVRSLDGQVVQRDQRADYQFAVGPDTGIFDVPPESTAPYDAVAAEIGDQHPDLFDRGNSIGLREGEPLNQVNLVPLAPDIFSVLGGTHHSLAIGTDHGVVVVEAPNDDTRSLAVQDAIAAAFPGKPIQFVINTHHHNDHVGGLRTYVARGIPVVAPAADLDFLHTVFTTPHTALPDTLSRSPRDAQLIGVTDAGWSFTDGRTIQAIQLSSEHVDHQLVVYIPDAKIVFQADLYYPHLVPVDQTPAPFRVTTRALYQALVIDRGLPVDFVASGHAGVATGEEFRIAAGY
jgi:glyoxylase-like metal-dependent hydrolase (beta-lactamase superfamily II)